jgi:hypothetical protein
MTHDETPPSPPRGIRHFGFGIISSFVIRHSSFAS